MNKLQCLDSCERLIFLLVQQVCQDLLDRREQVHLAQRHRHTIEGHRYSWITILPFLKHTLGVPRVSLTKMSKKRQLWTHNPRKLQHLVDSAVLFTERLLCHVRPKGGLVDEHGCGRAAEVGQGRCGHGITRVNQRPARQCQAEAPGIRAVQCRNRTQKHVGVTKSTQQAASNLEICNCSVDQRLKLWESGS